MNYYQEITLIPQAEIPQHFILSKVYTQLHLALVDRQHQYGNLIIGISFPEYRSEVKQCELAMMASPPEKDAIAALPVNNMGAYVMSNRQLYFIHKANQEFRQLAVSDHQLAQLNTVLKLNDMHAGETKRLSKIQLDEIKKITGHTVSTVSLGKKVRLFSPDEAMLQQLNLTKWLVRLNDYVHYTSIRPTPTKITHYANYRRQHLKGSVEKLARRYAKRHGISLEEALQHYIYKACNSPLPYVHLKSLTNQQPFRLLIEKKLCGELVQQEFNAYGLSSVSTVPEF